MPKSSSSPFGFRISLVIRAESLGIPLRLLPVSVAHEVSSRRATSSFSVQKKCDWKVESPDSAARLANARTGQKELVDPYRLVFTEQIENA